MLPKPPPQSRIAWAQLQRRGHVRILTIGGSGPVKQQNLFGLLAVHAFTPLSPSDGERVGVRGWFNCIFMVGRCPPAVFGVGQCRARFWTLPCPSARPEF